MRIKEKDHLVLEVIRGGEGGFPLVLGLLSVSIITGELD